MIKSAHVLSALGDGVYVTDRNRRILFWNNAAERITGWQRDEVIGRHCGDNVLCHTDSNGRDLCGEDNCPLRRAMTTNKASRSPIMVYAKTANGHRVPLEVSVSPILDNMGKVVGGIEIFRDLTNQLADLHRARKIQVQVMGQPQLSAGGLEFNAHYAPRDTVGGDFYVAERSSPSRFAFLLADVMGHGVTAALYTMYLRSVWEQSRCNLHQAELFFSEFNDRLVSLMEEDEAFASASFFEIDVWQHTLSFIPAGLPPGFIFRGNGRVEFLPAEGVPLGIETGTVSPPEVMNFQPGDKLLVYTDGATEVFNGEGKILGPDGLLKLLQKENFPKAPINFENLQRRLVAYSNELKLPDDLALLEIAFSG